MIPIQLKQVSVRYEGKEALFRNLDLSLEAGGFILIQGPSGSGKSSLLRIINRLQDPEEGEIWIAGRRIEEHEVTALRRRIGYVQQVPVMLDGSVRDNLMLPFQFRSSQQLDPPHDDELRTWLDRLLLEEVELEDQAQDLSVGQKQRVALIRILLVQPKVLLCDEPTSSLDSESKKIVEEWLERLNVEQEMGIILVSHTEVEFSSAKPKRYRLRKSGLEEVKT